MCWLIALALLVQEPKAGDRTTITFESSVELETVVRDGKGESTHLLNLTRKEKFAQVRMDAKTVKIDCLSSTLQRSGTDTPVEEQSSPLAGHTYFATRLENGWAVKDTDGGAPPNEGLNLGAWNDISVLMPAGGAAPKAGDKWTVEGKDLLTLIFPSALREGAGKFEVACESAEGGKATLVFSGSLTGKTKDEPQTSITLAVKAGRLTCDVASRKPASLLLNGSLESTTDIVDVLRKPGTGALINNEEERRKVGEISVKSHKLEVAVTFE